MFLPNSSSQKGSQYIDPTNELSNRELALGVWYVRHKNQLRSIGIMLLALWCAGTVGFSLWQWGQYLLFGYQQDELLYREWQQQLVNYRTLQPKYQAQSLIIHDVEVFRSAPNKYDLAASVQNPNPRHVAYVEYQFEFGSGQTTLLQATILPGQSRPLAALGIDSAQFPQAIRLNLVNVKWRRINPHRLQDVAGFMTERLKFTYSHFLFSSPDRNAGVPVPRITFDVGNNSAYSYWKGLFMVELFNGATRVGVVPLSLDQFLTGEIRPVDIRLFGDTPTVTAIVVSPIINLFDQSVYMAPPKTP